MGVTWQVLCQAFPCICAHLAREVIEENDAKLKVVTTLHGTDITLVGSEPEFFKMTKYGIQRSDVMS